MVYLATEDRWTVDVMRRLSVREVQVLLAIATGMRVMDTCLQYEISGGSYNQIRQRLFYKLCISNQAEAIVYALRYGFVRDDSQRSTKANR